MAEETALLKASNWAVFLIVLVMNTSQTRVFQSTISVDYNLPEAYPPDPNIALSMWLKISSPGGTAVRAFGSHLFALIIFIDYSHIGYCRINIESNTEFNITSLVFIDFKVAPRAAIDLI